MEWHTLELTMKKDLLLIMRRSTVPIEFTSSYIILMNLDSFVGVSTKCLLLHDIWIRWSLTYIWPALRSSKRNEFLKRWVLRTAFSKHNESFIYGNFHDLLIECIITKIVNVRFFNICCSYSKHRIQFTIYCNKYENNSVKQTQSNRINIGIFVLCSFIRKINSISCIYISTRFIVRYTSNASSGTKSKQILQCDFYIEQRYKSVSCYIYHIYCIISLHYVLCIPVLHVT